MLTEERAPRSRRHSWLRRIAWNAAEVSVKERILFCWSGGKDSAMALAELLRAGECEIAALLTTVTEDYDRISMHGVRRTLLEAQAASLGLPLRSVNIPAGCTNELYEQRMRQALETFLSQGIRRAAFGDLFLADIREYRERNLARAGMEAIFPLWEKDTAELARSFVERRFRAVLVCVDPRKLAASFAGREYDAALLASLPAGVDPCGENGEFHTFVYDGPIFREPVAFTRGETVVREGFCFADLLPPAQTYSASS